MSYDVIVIGAGQAGLATAYFLKKAGLRLILLDSAKTIGYSWRNRYDSLTLFTPAQYSSLPGLSFPLPAGVCPAKEQIAAYFEQYVSQYQLPVQLGRRVVRLSKPGALFELQVTSDFITSFYQAQQVVVATGSAQNPFVPAYQTQPDNSVFQVHSSQYRNPDHLPPGHVLMVGAGNSGAQLAVEIANQTGAAKRKVYLSAKEPIQFKPLSILGKSIFWWGEKTGIFNLSVHSQLGRHLQMSGEGVYNDDLKRLLQQKKIRLVPPIQSFAGSQVQFENGETESFRVIVWATGYRRDDSWIDIPGSMDRAGKPIQEAGISPVQGLYYVGIPWQRTMTSHLIFGAGRDAQFIADKILEKINVGLFK